MLICHPHTSRCPWQTYPNSSSPSIHIPMHLVTVWGGLCFSLISEGYRWDPSRSAKCNLLSRWHHGNSGIGPGTFEETQRSIYIIYTCQVSCCMTTNPGDGFQLVVGLRHILAPSSRSLTMCLCFYLKKLLVSESFTGSSIYVCHHISPFVRWFGGEACI